MRSRHRSRALVRRLLTAASLLGIFVVVRARLIDRNRDRYGPAPLESTSSARTA